MPEITWLTRYGPEGASSRYRAFQLADALAEHGWTSRLEPLAEWRGSSGGQLVGVGRRVRRLRTLDHDPGIHIIQKEPVMPPSLYRVVARSLRRTRVPIIWDIDDAVWLGRPGAEEMAADMCGIVDHVVAGNRSIGDWAVRHGAREITVVPTCFDPVAAPNTSSPGDGPRVVWVGSPATAPLVEPFAPQLRQALGALPTMSIEFVGGPPPPELRGHERVMSTAWSPDAELEALAAADFGLALQERSEYADHKCGFKIVQYLAYGIVPIASDGPVHAEMVGPHGLLIDGSTEASAVIDRLGRPPTDAERRALMDYQRRNYSVARATEAWSTVLAGVDPGDRSAP